MEINMEDIVLKRALSILTSIKASYIIEHNGSRYSEGHVEGRHEKRDGRLTAYVTKYIENLEVGQFVFIPPGEWTTNQVRSVSIAKAGKLWGVGSSTTSNVKEDEKIIGIKFMRLIPVDIETVADEEEHQ
jgi:hypothetical protein